MKYFTIFELISEEQKLILPKLSFPNLRDESEIENTRERRGRNVGLNSPRLGARKSGNR